MSKRNNKKKDKQEITQNEVHAMAQEWQNGEDDERVLVLFSLSEFGRLRFFVRGPRLQFLSLLDKEIIPTLNSLANESLVDSPAPPRTKRRRRKNERPAPHGGSAPATGSFRSTSKSKTAMQVIKFRGRSIADGSIVYGGVLHYATASYIVQPDTRHADGAPRCIEVLPDSVAQYIGVKTADGDEIYTGDEVSYYDMNNEETRRGIVRYDEETAAFYVAGVLQIPVYFESHFEYKLIS